MTNKINGIDVSECEYAADTIPVDCENNTCFCYEDENCYFKQLKRLQQELDIKEKMLDKFMIGSGETLEKLQKENEKLKARLKTLDDEVLTIEITPDEFERYKKYRQALEEIRKEIGDLKDINRLINLQKILDTINEVLEDRK